jgi:Flp pilus assembly protein TadD
VDAMLRRRLADAYDIFRQAAVLRPDDAHVNANLERLARMGFGTPAGAPGSTP